MHHEVRRSRLRRQLHRGPAREIVVRSRPHVEDFFFADIDPTITDKSWNVGRSLWSAREFGPLLLDAAKPKAR